jgi:predicted glycoside hydrolase/deacetylase ChbG (UPF0249 family)
MARSSAALAERLGFAAGDRIAIVHADDIGMCHAANAGAFDALANGVVTCGSIMVPCPWFREAADLARAHPEADLGVHLTLNSEWPQYRWAPVAGRDRVPSLVDAEGYLPRTLLEVLRNAKPEHVEIELRAQVAMALAAGIDVTHLDSHMGTVLLDPFVGIYVKLAEELRLPVFAARPDPKVLKQSGLAGFIDVLRKGADLADRAGLPILDGAEIQSLDFADGDGERHTTERLARVGPGVHYFIIHPAKDGEELRTIAPDAHARAFEHRFYGSVAGRDRFAKENIRTIGMRALRTLLRAS